ncbi:MULTISPECIES: hypothetical protein [unclassified Isoptericola]|uniref:hypothetical protein n=1 Tax=unclassified Isoptericola TaxID=2623355 RepID=UPI00364FEE6D
MPSSAPLDHDLPGTEAERPAADVAPEAPEAPGAHAPADEPAEPDVPDGWFPA